MYKIHGYYLQTSYKRHLGKGKKTWQGGMAYLARISLIFQEGYHILYNYSNIYIISQIYAHWTLLKDKKC